MTRTLKAAICPVFLTGIFFSFGLKGVAQDTSFKVFLVGDAGEDRRIEKAIQNMSPATGNEYKMWNMNGFLR
jgi:hypothetical protein